MKLREIRLGGVEWIDRAEDRSRRRALVNTEMTAELKSSREF
jgi:hypothetical protein